MRLFAAVSVLLPTAPSSASFVVRSTLTKHTVNGVSPHKGRARAASLKSRGNNGPISAPAIDIDYSFYIAQVGIGNPPSYYDLIIDTGSSNTFCGTAKPCVRTNTRISTGQLLNDTFGPGVSYFSGIEYLDEVTLASNLIIQNQSIGVAVQSSGFPPHVDGLLGLGPVDLTHGTLSSEPNATIPTVLNNLFSQGLIEHQVLGIYFSPTESDNDTNGVITYGGIDTSLYEGELTYVPVTKTKPASAFWGINITEAKYGDKTIVPGPIAGIVDSGTTLIYLGDQYFSAYMDAIHGAYFDPKTSRLVIPDNSVTSMQPLTFSIADQSFTLDAAAQLLPKTEDIPFGGVAGIQYGFINTLGNLSEPGFDFVFGQKFMERYYTVFDADNQRVGFAQTKKTFGG